MNHELLLILKARHQYIIALFISVYKRIIIYMYMYVHRAYNSEGKDDRIEIDSSKSIVYNWGEKQEALYMWESVNLAVCVLRCSCKTICP